jgi:hypothetical protein
VQCPSPIGTVRDLHRNSLTVAGEHPRTNTNETEIETTWGRRRGSRSAARSVLDAGNSRPIRASHRPDAHGPLIGASQTRSDADYVL